MSPQQKVATEASATKWRERERGRALRRFREATERATAELEKDLTFIASCTVFEDAYAVYGGVLRNDGEGQ